MSRLYPKVVVEHFQNKIDHKTICDKTLLYQHKNTVLEEMYAFTAIQKNVKYFITINENTNAQ